MSETKFTPGEWIQGIDPHPLSKNALLIANKTPDGERVLICEVHEFVPMHLRDVDVDDCTRQEAMANAALIALSPAMFSALVDLVKSERSGVAVIGSSGINYCTHCFTAAPDVKHTDDCPIVVARNLIETLSETEKETI